MRQPRYDHTSAPVWTLLLEEVGDSLLGGASFRDRLVAGYLRDTRGFRSVQYRYSRLLELSGKRLDKMSCLAPS
jgi:hypothetical protein